MKDYIVEPRDYGWYGEVFDTVTATTLVTITGEYKDLVETACTVLCDASALQEREARWQS